jgi:hypothetical protein
LVICYQFPIPDSHFPDVFLRTLIAQGVDGLGCQKYS